MRLTVLSVAFPFAPVGPDAVGGAEQVLASLDAALVARGHRSIVVAQRGSRADGELVELPALDPSRAPEAHAAWGDAIERVLAREPVSVVHLHGLDAHAYRPATRVPVVCSLHLPPALYDARTFSSDLVLTCVSRSQRRACAAAARVIPNGIELARFAPRRDKGRYALALGRICPEKGYHLAIEAARRAGVQLVLAGRVFAYDDHRRYFAERIRPELGEGCVFLGPAGPSVRRQLLARARCLLVPSLVEETSSLVAMEALASGTPVVAFRHGALPEVVAHGVTGFLVDDARAMADAIARTPGIDPSVCRRAAEERFDATRMHEAYLALYHELARGARAVA